jgi:hypothetical protein
VSDACVMRVMRRRSKIAYFHLLHCVSCIDHLLLPHHLSTQTKLQHWSVRTAGSSFSTGLFCWHLLSNFFRVGGFNLYMKLHQPGKTCHKIIIIFVLLLVSIRENRKNMKENNGINVKREHRPYQYLTTHTVFLKKMDD